MKVFENIVAGILYIPIDQFMTETEGAYGTWEWWMNKVGASNITNIQFISDRAAPDAGIGAYTLGFNQDEKIIFSEVGISNRFETAASAISINTWYKLRVTRSAEGEFTAYLDNVLIDVSGGSGTNPTTDNTIITSKWVLFNLDAGDKVAIADVRGNHSFTKRLGVV